MVDTEFFRRKVGTINAHGKGYQPITCPDSYEILHENKIDLTLTEWADCAWLSSFGSAHVVDHFDVCCNINKIDSVSRTLMLKFKSTDDNVE